MRPQQPSDYLSRISYHEALRSRRDFLSELMLGTAFAWTLPGTLNAETAAVSLDRSGAPLCSWIPGTRFQLSGPVGHYLRGVTDQWLKVAPESNPAMLEMFRDRDRRPLREMVPWAGEFAGKYLTSAVQVWRLTEDPSLRRYVADFVARLVARQDADGYLGPWPRDSRLTGRAPNIGEHGGETWDAWGHYHVMLGLLLWEEESGDVAALNCARRIGDLFCAMFGGNRRLVDTGSTEMNLAPIHSLCLLYRRTADERYLQLGLKICDEFATKGTDGKPLAGDYLHGPLADITLNIGPFTPMETSAGSASGAWSNSTVPDLHVRRSE